MNAARFIDAAGLTRWAEGAASGAALSLGRGAAVPLAVAPTVSALVDAGVIDFARRRLNGGDFEFVAQRRSGAAGVRRGVADRAVAVRRGAIVQRSGVAERRIFKALAVAATRGLPCPTNAQLAQLAGLSGALAASYRLHRLVWRGLIAVEVPADPRARRIVTILASGAMTRRHLGA